MALDLAQMLAKTDKLYKEATGRRKCPKELTGKVHVVILRVKEDTVVDRETKEEVGFSWTPFYRVLSGTFRDQEFEGRECLVSSGKSYRHEKGREALRTLGTLFNKNVPPDQAEAVALVKGSTGKKLVVKCTHRDDQKDPERYWPNIDPVGLAG